MKSVTSGNPNLLDTGTGLAVIASFIFSCNRSCDIPDFSFVDSNEPRKAYDFIFDSLNIIAPYPKV